MPKQAFRSASFTALRRLSVICLLWSCSSDEQQPPSSSNGSEQLPGSEVRCGDGQLIRSALGDRFARLEWTACIGPATYEVYANGSRVWSTLSTSAVVEVEPTASVVVVALGSPGGPVEIGASAGVEPLALSQGLGRSQRASRPPSTMGR